MEGDGGDAEMEATKLAVAAVDLSVQLEEAESRMNQRMLELRNAALAPSGRMLRWLWRRGSRGSAGSGAVGATGCAGSRAVGAAGCAGSRTVGAAGCPGSRAVAAAGCPRLSRRGRSRVPGTAVHSVQGANVAVEPEGATMGSSVAPVAQEPEGAGRVGAGDPGTKGAGRMPRSAPDEARDGSPVKDEEEYAET
ncbi:hypothetical protein CYMTET_49904 [Cymbomonas tetramitiformis]|uniref:Uncharacterized protein n=1 Tax=Cymbomonas tetramitiformis TaxID=36881 RepID=A0AAE0EU91_9CHLO|nr:hypothetical protein CYMTET_49904 [Cymbomonas tetramitiformis]